MSKVDIDQEVMTIMNRIETYETKKQKLKMMKPITLVVAVALLVLIPIFSNENPGYKITQISANEYHLNIFGDDVYFNLYAFVENPNRIQITENIYTYENQVKYFDVTSQLEVKTIEIEDQLFLAIAKKDNSDILKYYYVNNDVEESRGLVPIDREFHHFEQEMSDVLKLEKKYPMISYVDSSGICTQYQLNEKANELTSEQLEDYEWLQSIKNQVFCSTGGINSIKYVLQFNGTVDEIGEVIPEKSMIYSGGGVGAPTFDPVEIENKKLITTNTSGIDWVDDMHVMINRYYYEGEVEPEELLTLNIDFQQLNSTDYDIEVMFDEKPVEILYQKNEDNKVYMISDFLKNISEYRLEEIDEGEPKLYEVFDKTISIIVKDKKTGKVIQEILNSDGYMMPASDH
ncbi:MAG: hypothetical protein Q3980_11935 [Turicibacter sp.]|nr:hypothetical protein [Turicibacter sp.]